jgi:hypothetical protein
MFFLDSYVARRVRKSVCARSRERGGDGAGVLQGLGMREFAIYFQMT